MKTARRPSRWVTDFETQENPPGYKLWIVRRGKYVGAWCASQMIAKRIVKALNAQREPFLRELR